MNKVFVLFFVFLLGCTSTGFDITQPIIDLTSKQKERKKERIHWFDYNDKEIANISSTTNRCVLFYLKRELSCWECYSLNDSFKDPRVVFLLNRYFVSYKLTNDMEDFEKGLSRLGVRSVPYVIIAKTKPKELLASRGGLVSTKELLRMIINTVDKCK